MKDTSQLLEQLNKIAVLFKRHVVTIAIVGFAILCGYTMTLTMQLSAAEPSKTEVEENSGSAVRPRVDPSVVDAILGLQDQNVQVRAIFNEARKNPFDE